MNMIRYIALLLAFFPAIALGATTSTPPSNCAGNGSNTVCNPLIGNVQAADQNLSLDQRPPAQTDSSSSAYANPYSFWAWHQPNGTRVYQQLLNNAGFPQWNNATITGAPLPANATTATPAACWGLKRINAAYNNTSTNPILKAQFADTTTLDIQQLPSGVPDQAALWSAAQTHGFPARVTTWYDQCNVGGTQANATQATAANQPLLIIDRDGDLAIAFDQWTGTGTTSATRFLTISTNLAVTENAMSAFMVEAFRSTSTGTVNMIQIGATGGANVNQLVHTWSSGLNFAFSGTTGGGIISSLPSLTYFFTSPTGYTLSIDGWPTLVKTTNRGANALTGGQLGQSTGSPAATTTMGYIQYMGIVYASTLSAADVTAETVAIHAMGKTTPQARCTITNIGESVGEGFNTLYEQAWTYQLQEMLPKSVRLYNFATAGQGIGSTANPAGKTNITSYPSGAVLTYNAASRCNIAIINGGNTNDYYNGASTPLIDAATELGYINTMAGLAKASGFNPVFVLTPIDRAGGGAAFYTQLATIRDGIVSNAGANGYIPIRLDQDPELGTYNSSASNSACFVASAHLTPACAGEEAADVKAAIAPYIRPGG